MRFTTPLLYLISLSLLSSVAVAKEAQNTAYQKCNSQKVACKIQQKKGKNLVQKNHTTQKAQHKTVKPVPKKIKVVKKIKPIPFHSGMHVVTSQRLNIRAQPATHSPVVGTLRHGMKINVIRKQGAWYEIIFNQKRAWVYSAYLKAIY